MHDLERTIVAVATPPGRGGVGCLRLSGPQAVSIAEKLFRPRGAVATPEAASSKAGTPPALGSLADLPALRPKFGSFVDREGQLVDHGYLVRFAGKAAFTGESSVELWPHGSPPVLRALLDAALALGADASEPGEFTYRALRNGRIDLTRAEAVRDLIDARTLYQAKLAYAQAEGRVAEEVEPLRLQMEEWIARGEAAVEFVDESETHLTRMQLGEAVVTATERCAELLDGFKTGRMVRSGATLVLTGRPNVGKSSLFNALLQRHRAIVTEVPGTTRDTLEEELDLDGIPLRLVDTAGLRDVNDPVESEGVRRAHQAREEADLELWVFDAARALDRGEHEAIEAAASEGELNSRRIVVWNKRDLECVAAPLQAADLSPAARDWFVGAIEVSAKTGEGLEALRTALRDRLVGSGPLEDPVITDGRHAAALERTRDSLALAATAYKEGLSEELVLEDLRMAMDHLGSITGQFTTEDLYDKVFSTFCIGK